MARVFSCLRVPLQAGLIVAAGWFVYAPAFHGARLWDDKLDFPEERLAFNLSGLAKVWSGALDRDYYPIKATVQWIEWRLWRDDMLGYHLTNVGLHLLGAFLLWRLLGKLGVRHAWVGGLLFTVHPLAVESVAWLSEIKNVLSLPPLLGAMLAYLNFEEIRPRHFLTAEGAEIAEKRMGSSSPRSLRPLRFNAWGWYVLSLVLFILAMLCKSSVVMFPVVLLLYCWWRRGRIGRSDLWATAPYFCVSLILGLVEVAYQHRMIGGANLDTGGALSRIAVSGMAAAFYFFKCVLPVGLLPVYPRWAVNPPSAVQFLPWIGIGMVIAWLWLRCRGGRDWARHGLFGLGFFLVNLVPVLGFVPMSFQHISWVADFFAYLPLAGLAGLAAAAFSLLDLRLPILGSFAAAVLVVALAVESHRYARNFRSDEALWTYTLQRDPDSWAAHCNLGLAFAQSGRMPEALDQYREALRFEPDYAEARDNLGIALADSGRFAEALVEFRKALRIKPDYAEAHNNMGLALANSGHLPEAMEEYREALRLKPDYAAAHNNLGSALAVSGRLPEALEEYREVLRLMPDYADARNNMGNALIEAGRAPEAITEFAEALRLQPGSAQIHNNMGNALRSAGRLPEAILQFREAVRLSPDFAEAQNNLGVALVMARRTSEGVYHLEQAVMLKPGYAEALRNLVVVLRAMGRNAEAEAYLRRAAQFKADRGAER